MATPALLTSGCRVSLVWLVQMESLLGTIAIHVLICVAVPNAVSLLGTLGSEEFRFLYGIAGKALRRKRGNL